MEPNIKTNNYYTYLLIVTISMLCFIGFFVLIKTGFTIFNPTVKQSISVDLDTSSALSNNASQSNEIINEVPVTIPTPSKINKPGEFACDPIGVCSHYIKTESMGCPQTFSDFSCGNGCGDKTIWCEK